MTDENKTESFLSYEKPSLLFSWIPSLLLTLAGALEFVLEAGGKDHYVVNYVGNAMGGNVTTITHIPPNPLCRPFREL